MIKNLKTVFRLIPILILTSCALNPISSEFEVIQIDKDKIHNTLGNGKVLIFNGSDWKHTIDNTARLNIWIEKRVLGQIRAKEYVVVDLKNGEYNFTVLHIDLVKMKSQHKITIDKNTKVIRISPTITSNKVEITNELPKKFDKYKQMESR